MRTVALIVPCGRPSASWASRNDVVPQPRLEVALELRQEQVRARPALEQTPAFGERRCRSRRGSPRPAARRPHMPLEEVPPARAHEQHRDLVLQRVAPLRSLDRIVRSIASVRFCWPPTSSPRSASSHPRSRPCSLRARVERVDDHLPVARRAGDLDAAVLEVGRHGCDAPVALADRRSLEKSGSSPARSRSSRAARASSSRSRLRLTLVEAATRSSASGVSTPYASGPRRVIPGVKAALLIPSALRRTGLPRSSPSARASKLCPPVIASSTASK